MNTFGHNFRLSIWGESHGEQIGITLDGIPVGMPLTEAEFEADMARRRSGTAGTTARHEEDRPRIVSGLYEGRTTGAPLTLIITNNDTRPQDYTSYSHHYRPSHADLTAAQKFGGMNDPRGGGHFSGRLTALLVAAGVVAKKLLGNVHFDTRIAEIGGCADAAQFDAIIAHAVSEGDSVGGVIQCRASNIPAGLGEPFFDSAESLVAHLLFAIPGIKGVEFGSGFGAAHMRGSEHNDPILDAQGTTATNHAGGINGGITNGNELVVRAAVKPASSIAREQITYDAATGSMKPLSVQGRHDACIAVRCAVVVEAAVSIALADMLLCPRAAK